MNETVFRTRSNDLRNWIKPIATLVSEAHIEITPTELYIRAVDLAHVAMMESAYYHKKQNIPQLFGETPRYNKGTIDISLDELLDALPTKNETVGIKIVPGDEEDNGQLFITSHITGTVQIDGLDVVYSQIRIPVLESLPSSFIIKSDLLLSGIKEIAKTSDIVYFQTREHIHTISSLDGKRQIPLRTCKTIDSGDAKSGFPTTYLSHLLSAIPKDIYLTLYIGNDMPIKIMWDNTTYFLAPRIDHGD